jgi:hypothetical protein
MNNWKRFTVLAILTVLLLSSCFTTKNIGTVEPRKVANRVYTVSIPGNYSEEDRIYAISSFVQFMSYESYNAEQTRRPNFLGKNYYEYKVTVPGATPIVDVPEEVKSKLRLDFFYFYYE